MSASNIWDRVLARIETKVNRHSYYTWFKPTAFLQDDGATLTVRVPNGLFRNWLTKHYAAIISEALAEVGRPDTRLAYSSEEVLPEATPVLPPLPTEIL